MRDIADRKKRERELEEYRTLVEAANTGIVTVDTSNEIRTVNPAVEEVFGYEADELVGKQLTLLMSPETASRHESAFNRYLETGEKTLDWSYIEVEGQHRDGSSIPLAVSFGEVTHEDRQLFVGVLRDITVRKEREQELRELNRRHELALETTNTGIWEWDLETDEVVWSEELEELVGLQPGSFDGTYEAYQEYLHPESVDKLERAIQETLEEDGTFDEDFRMIRQDGEAIWVHGEGQIFTGDGPKRMLGTTTEITERKARERELERQNERLDSFASMLSHDIRSPLSVAAGNLELAMEQFESEELQTVNRALSRIDRLLEDILALARDEDLEKSLGAADLAELGDRCWDSLSPKDHSINIETNQTVQAEAGRLRQLLENLIRNALEHGGDEVSVTLGELDDGFYVEDDGPGIPPDERETVFDPGYSTSEEGTGYGLKIVQEIAESHGWSVTVTEGDNGGSRFEVTGVKFE